jgi:hypothetical protein
LLASGVKVAGRLVGRVLYGETARETSATHFFCALVVTAAADPPEVVEPAVPELQAASARAAVKAATMAPATAGRGTNRTKELVMHGTLSLKKSAPSVAAIRQGASRGCRWPRHDVAYITFIRLNSSTDLAVCQEHLANLPVDLRAPKSVRLGAKAHGGPGVGAALATGTELAQVSAHQATAILGRLVRKPPRSVAGRTAT